MNNKIIDTDAHLQDYRTRLSSLLIDVAQLAAKTGSSTLIEKVDGLTYSIDRPFMFVVVGEVKAGKSSFVNALLENEICATDVKPCTDTIQVLDYSEQAYRREVDPHLVEIGKPIEILKEISIVDTPGTNSIVENHQLITKDFIPNSDLAFFVLFAKNPYFASTWEFLSFVSTEWYRKVVFVLQQSDLLRSQELLEENIAEVKKLAEGKGIKDPTVFATSAELELNEEKENSGFNEIRSYIKDLVTNKEAYRLKLENITRAIQVIIGDLGSDVETLEARLKLDKEAVSLLKRRFKRGRQRSANEIEVTVGRVVARYNNATEDIKADFRHELSFLSVAARTLTFRLKQKLEDFSERCKVKLKSQVEEVTHEQASHILDGIHQFGEDLKQDLDRISVETLRIQQDRFDIKVLERRQDLLENITRKVENTLSDKGLVTSLSAGSEGAILGAGGALAVVAIVVAQIIEQVIAQFVLAAAIEVASVGIGIVAFAIGFAWQRHRIIEKFERALDSGSNDLKRDITRRLNEKLDLIYDDLERECAEFYQDVEAEEAEIAPLLRSYASVQTKLVQLPTQASEISE